MVNNSDPRFAGEQSDETSGVIDRLKRRRFLSAISAGTAAVTAGCTTVHTVEARAEPVVLTENARTGFGVVEVDRQSVTETVERSTVGVGVSADLTNHIAIYSLHDERGPIRFGDGVRGRRSSTGGVGGNDMYREGVGEYGAVEDGRIDDRTVMATPLTVGILATPSASVGGWELNPRVGTELTEFLSIEAGQQFLQTLGHDITKVVAPPEVVAYRELSDTAGFPVDGEERWSDLVGFAGLIDTDDSPLLVFGNLVTASRGESTDDVVLAAGVRERTIPAGTTDDVLQQPLFGDEGVLTPDGLAATVSQTTAFLPHLEAMVTGRRPFGDTVTADPDLKPGEYVSDREDPNPDLAVVLATPDIPIVDWLVYGEETVADHNPDHDLNDPVVIIAYERLLEDDWPEWHVQPVSTRFAETVDRGVKFHAFPRSRLARHLLLAGG